MNNFDEILEYCQENNRICPQPTKWKELYELLKNKKQKSSGGWEPSLPLILAAWYEPHLLKIIRFREHIEWAEKQGQLEEISSFLKSLKEDEWFHTND